MSKGIVQTLVAIGFGIILLEIMVLARTRNWFEFTNLRLLSLTSAAGLIYFFIFDRKKKKS